MAVVGRAVGFRAGAGRRLALACGALALLAAALALLAPPAGAFATTDSFFEARDQYDGGPANVYSLWAGEDWTCPDETKADDSTSLNLVAGVLPAFNLQFYGQTIDRFYADTNGYVGLHAGTARDTSRWTPASIPTPGLTPNGFVAAHWEDLDGTGGGVCYLMTGTSPERVLAVIYKGVPFAASGGSVQALVLFYEAGDLIEVHIFETDSDLDGRRESFGVESPDGTMGIQHDYSELVDRTSSIQYRPLTSFPEANPEEYVFDWNQTQVLKVFGATSGYPLPLDNDKQLGNVRLHAVYMDGLPATAHIYPYTDADGCDFAMPEQFAENSAFCFTTSDRNPCLSGPYQFTYRADDAYLDDASSPYMDQAKITIRTTNCNRVPNATADEYDVIEDFPLVVAAPGILGNDNDPDDDTIAVDAPGTFTGLQGGILQLAADGSFRYDPARDYVGDEVFTYRLRDGRGLRNLGPVNITFHVLRDMPPVPRFGSPAHVPAGVVFRATDSSYDLEGPIVARVWDFGTPSPAGIAPPDHMYLYPGTYSVTLTVTDIAGVSSTARHTIIADPTPPAPPSTPNPDDRTVGPHDYQTEAEPAAAVLPHAPDFGVDAGADQQVDELGAVRLVATAHDGTAPYAYTWTQTAGPLVRLTASGDGLAFTAPDVPRGGAVLRFLATAIDSAGASATDAIVVQLRDVPHAPTVLVDGPGSAALGTTISLVATATDPDGDTLTVTWRVVQGDALLGTDPADPLRATVTPGPGETVIEAVAWDGEMAGKATFRILVEPPAPPAPAAQRAVPVPAQADSLLPTALALTGGGLALGLLVAILLVAVRSRRRDGA